jgi:hypothetical protein
MGREVWVTASAPARQRRHVQRAAASPAPSRTPRQRAVGMRQLQLDVGNRGLHRLLLSRVIRVKRTVAPADEAVSADLESYLATTCGAAQPLAASARSYFEPRFGREFGDVRVHTDGAADRASTAIGARAFTTGTDVYFGAGQFRPGTGEGDRLLGHELTHVVQQAPGRRTARRASTLVQRQAGAAPRSTIRGGARGPLVTELQTLLNTAGVTPPLTVDGVFGPLTVAAVVAFQAGRGLTPDGIVGPRTWAALTGASAPAIEPSPPAESAAAFLEPVISEAEDVGTAPTDFQEANESPGVETHTAIGTASCETLRDDCYACCGRLHPWWDSLSWLKCLNCCREAHKQCLVDGAFPCLCKA